MGNNASLRKADRVKEDEFYTQLEDIEKELKHYRNDFKGKIVLCNCDDPYESNFFKYFAMNFNAFGLKKLITTCHATSPIVNTQLNVFGEEFVFNTVRKGKRAFKIEINEVLDYNKDGAVDLADVELLLKNQKNTLSLLNGDGDFRSEECVNLLKQADIVATNPPFSLFREYVAQLIEYDKRFIIIGGQNAITYKEIFSLMQQNKLWLGYYAGDMAFTVPDYYEERETRFWIDKNGQKWRSLGNICWYTNLDTTKRHQDLLLFKTYNEEEYPKYDNYDAINVDKVSNIPCDYDGIMGVPITFFDKYNPDQFEVIDGIGRYSILDNERTKKEGKYLSMISGKAKYFRIIIKKKR